MVRARHAIATIWYERECARCFDVIKKLPTYLQPEKFTKCARYGVADLPMRGASIPYEAEIFGKRLEAGKLFDREQPTSPMERASSGTGNRLNSPRRLALRKLQQE